jgi:DNA-binding IclR family transcriptional regulator
VSTLQDEQQIDPWAKHREKITSSILKILRQRPHTIPELAKKLDLSYTATFEWLTRMNQIEVVYEDKAAWIGLGSPIQY